jgi:hypothetical protein
MGPHYRTPPECSNHPRCATPPAKPNGTRRNAEISGRTPPKRDYLRIMESIHCKLLLHQEKGWEVTPHSRLPTYQQMDKEKSKHVPFNPANY